MVACHPYFVHPYDKPSPEPHALASGHSWTVPALCKRYDWPTGLPGNGVIAIVELGGGWRAADVQKYFNSVGLPAPNIMDVSVDGTVNDPGHDDADFEVALDIQVAGASFAVATGRPATIHIYWAKDIAPAVRRAAQDGCAVCSISWGADEAEWGRTEAEDMQAAAAEANAIGMPVLAASGDNDSGDGGVGAHNVDVPAACPNIVGCGGTSLPHVGPEAVWNNNPGKSNGEGTGGGYSRFFPMPTWQLDGGAPPGPHHGRMVPDMAANADPVHGYQIIVAGQQEIVGGTSAVAPLLAGLLAACSEKLGDIGPVLWQHPEAFADIIQGDNGLEQAKQGPDACTGLGRPNAGDFAKLF